MVTALREAQDPAGVLLDDYVERTFNPAPRARRLRERILPTPARRSVWEEPWVGIFHNPPDLPEWLLPSAHPRRVFAEERFRKSRAHLRGAIALSEYLATWLRAELAVPVVSIKHSTEFPPATFSWEAFAAKPQKQLVQVGWYLRNYRAIYQVAVPEAFQKVHLVQDTPFTLEARRRTDRYSPYRERLDVGEVRVVSWLADAAYDRLLTESVVFVELFDASANNAVIEAIARETPVVVNRHPAVAEYLGEDYPLFYDDIGEVAELLALPRIREAHAYLRALDKSALRADHFVAALRRFIREVC